MEHTLWSTSPEPQEASDKLVILLCGGPYYSYSIIYPQNPILIIKADILWYPYRSPIVTRGVLVTLSKGPISDSRLVYVI